MSGRGRARRLGPHVPAPDRAPHHLVAGHDFERPETVASAIRIGSPASKEGALGRARVRWPQRALQTEILAAQEMLAQEEGVFCEPASAAGIAGLLKLASEGRGPEGTIVSVLTGHGLKEPDVILGRVQLPDPVPATFEAVARFIKRSVMNIGPRQSPFPVSATFPTPWYGRVSNRPLRPYSLLPMISVRVPATSANLGPGYDAVGLALSLSMRIGLDRSPHPEIEIRGTGADLIPRGPEHPAYRAARFVAELVGESDAQFRLVQENSIPPTRGLGGSAAALVGGAVAANDLFGGQIAAPDLLSIVCELDGHPDNAAPALLGGLVIGTLTPVGVSAVRLEPKDLKVVVAVPDFAVSTTAARRALPDSVPHRDATFNVGRSGLLLGALATGEYHLLRVAMQDRLHQPYRSHLIPGLEDVIEVA